jgi:Fe-S-cluster containining protein
MEPLSLTEDEQAALAAGGQVTLGAPVPANLYSAGDTVVFAEGTQCMEVKAACSLCKGVCCRQKVIVTPLEMWDIVQHTGKAPCEFCELVPAPDYVRALKDYQDVYFQIDKGVLLLAPWVRGARNCVFGSPTGCVLPQSVKPSTCRVFPFNYRSNAQVWAAGVAAPTAVEYYWPGFPAREDRPCLLVKMYLHEPVRQHPLATLFEIMNTDYREVTFGCWKALRSIPFWNDIIYPRLRPGDGVAEVYALVQKNYDEVAIYGQSLAYARRAWFGEE